MEVALFCEGYNEQSIVSQPWKHVHELARRMQSSGNTVHILTDRTSESSETEGNQEIPIHKIDRKGLLLNSDQVAATLHEIDADIANWFGGPLSAIHLWRLRGLLKEELVWTLYKGGILVEDLSHLSFWDIFHLKEFWTNALYSVCPAFIVKRGAEIPRVRRIIAWSARLKKYLTDMRIDEKRVTVIPSGVDTEVFHPLSASEAIGQRKQMGLAPSDFVILYFGPTSRFRGFDTVLKSMPDIVARIPSAKLLLLDRSSDARGHGALQSIYATRTKSGNSALRTVRGILNLKQLIRLLSVANTVVLPFRFWPHQECPLTILEAMAMGKPVITTHTGSIPEIVEDGRTGILITAGDHRRLSGAVTRLYMDEDFRLEVGKRAREYVRKAHDWNIVVRRTVTAYGYAQR
jgi:glycosyltransferase involved in cell wall biosynthesis